MIRVLAVVPFLVAWGLAREAQHRLKKHGWHRIIYRWGTGKSWHGQDVGEDRWAWPGSWFWRMHRAKRALVRMTVSVLVLSLPYWWVRFQQVTLWALLIVACCGLVLSVYLSARAAVTWRHRHRWERPLHLRAHPVAGIGRSQSPSSWISVERDRSKVALKLPQDWAANQQDQKDLVSIVVATIGIEQPEVTWRLAGPAPMLTVAASKPPPSLVRLEDVRQAIESAKPDELVWGIGKHGRVIKSSLSGDSPHIGLSMGSGAGKSIAIRAIIAQMLYHGAIALVLDYKQLSQNWARGLPNVSIVRHPHEIHAALCWLGGDNTRKDRPPVIGEINRRNAVALAGADLEGNVHSVVGPRLIIAAEELNATMKALRAYWRQMRDLDKSLPVRSPALDAFDMVNLMGRQVLMNALYVGQKLSAKAVGGDGDVRESIGVLAMGRYRPSTWKQLAEDHPMPPATRTPGRFQIVADNVSEVQGMRISAVDARELALAGVVSPLPAGMPGAVSSETREAITPADMPFVSETTPFVPGPRGLVTLSEAVDEQIVNRSLHAVRKASQRPGFPQAKGLRGTARVYAAIDLIAWDEN